MATYDPFANAVVYGADGQREEVSTATVPPVATEAPPPAPPEPEPVPEKDGESLTEPIEAVEEAPSEAEPPVESEPPEEPRSRAQQRFSDLARERNEARSERDKAQGELAALQRELDFYRQQALQPPPAPPPPVQDGVQRTPQGRPVRPTEEAYATAQDYHAALGQYEDALMQWHTGAAIVAYEQQRVERDAISKIVERFPDFHQVVQSSRIPVNADISAAIQASPDKPAVLYHLATHPDEALRLQYVQGYQAFRAIAALEAHLAGLLVPPQANGELSPPPPPAPPPPIAPPRAAPVRAPRGYEDVSFLEFYDQRNKEDMARRR